MKDLLKSMRYLKPYAGRMVGAFILLLVSTGLNLLQPRLSQWAVDRGIAGGNVQLLLLIAGGVLASAAFASFINYRSGVLLIRGAQGMGCDLRNALFRKVSSFSFSNFDKWRTGELMVRMNSDVNTVRMFMRMGMFMLIQSIFMIAGSLAAMYTTNTAMANMMAIIMLATLALFFALARFIRPFFMKVREALDKLNNVLQENLAGAKLVRAFSRQSFEEEKFREKNQHFFDISVRIGYLLAVFMPLLFFIGNGALLAASWKGGIQVGGNALNLGLASAADLAVVSGLPEKGLTLGKLLAFNNYAMMAVFPLLMLAMVLNFIAMAIASAKRINQLLEEEPDVKDSPDVLPVKRLDGNIAFDDVCFRYGHGENSLEGITLSIRKGEKIGIIGTTGAGKSTLVGLIPRYYDVCGGKVLLDGNDVTDLALDVVRKRVTLVLQESVLFSGTIEENIRFGRPDASFEEVEQAARDACAEEFILSLGKKWDEEIGERGLTLSGGQRQRIAIARALLAQPDILILDDVTSALDLHTESMIIENLYSRGRERTIIIISQKINAVRRADRIFVMDNGSITAAGSHDSLLKASPLYREMHETQSIQVRER